MEETIETDLLERELEEIIRAHKKPTPTSTSEEIVLEAVVIGSEVLLEEALRVTNS